MQSTTKHHSPLTKHSASKTPLSTPNPVNTPRLALIRTFPKPRRIIELTQQAKADPRPAVNYFQKSIVRYYERSAITAAISPTTAAVSACAMRINYCRSVVTR
jgi:hypothetical protein